MYLLIGTALVDFLIDTSHKEKPTFFAGITLGTIFFVSRPTRKLFQESYEPKVAEAIKTLQASSNKAIIEVGNDVYEAFYSDSPISSFSV